MDVQLIFLWGLVNLCLAILSIYKIRQETKKCQFIWWWAFPIGAFVWEDMLVFGLLHFALALVSFYLSNPFIWLVGYVTFWVVRSAGETLYFFLQQFILPSHHPHDIDYHYGFIRNIFGNISLQKCLIISQVFMQSVLVISLVTLIYLLTCTN